jgi:phosphatidylglycerol lysyltransferase
MRYHWTEVWSVRLASCLTALMGIVNILSAITPSMAERIALLAKFSPLEVRNGSHLAATLGGFALLLFAGKLWRRKRAAWLLTILVLLISAASHLLKGLDFEEALLGIGLAIWLLFQYPHFHAKSDQPSVRQGLRVLVYALGFTLAYGVAGFYLLDHQFKVNFGFWAAVRQTVTMFTQFYDPGLEPVTGFGRYFADSIYSVSAATLGYALLMLVRPVFAHHASSPVERERARKIVEAFGRSSLARFTLFGDKLHYFSRDGSVIAFVVKGGIALALGDPVGPAEDCAAAITEFAGFCARNDWEPAFYQAHSGCLEAYRGVGLNILCIGHEAIVNLDGLTLEGKVGKNLRTPLNRLTKLGYQAEIYLPPLAGNLIHKLRLVSDEWLTMVQGTEKRFSLGWFDDDYIGNSPVGVVMAPDGTITAFANLVPAYQRNEVAVDLMRRVDHTEPGTMEVLFLALFNWAKSQGYATFNLGLSALAGVGKYPGDPALERALNFIYENYNRLYNFKGLHAFKEKFHPDWSPRYLVYPSPAKLPAVLTALIRADSGDDFWWRVLRR